MRDPEPVAEGARRLQGSSPDEPASPPGARIGHLARARDRSSAPSPRRLPAHRARRRAPASQEECTLATATASATKLRPLGDRVVIQPTPREEMTKSGIVLPDTAKEKPQ